MNSDQLRVALVAGTLLVGGASYTTGERAPAPIAPAQPIRFIQLPTVEIKPLPAPRPVEAKPKPKPQVAKPKPPLKKSLPSCEYIKREYKRMSLSEQLAAYRSASAEEIAHGKRCLGF